jgi:hypothetical protein
LRLASVRRTKRNSPGNASAVFVEYESPPQRAVRLRTWDRG